MAHHAREVEAKSVFPRERPIIETGDVIFPYISEGKLTHGVRHDFQLPACTGPSEALSSSNLIPACLAKSAGHRGRGLSRSLNRNLLSAFERGAKITWAGAPSLAPNEYVEKFFCIKHSVSPSLAHSSDLRTVIARTIQFSIRYGSNTKTRDLRAVTFKPIEI